MSRLIDADALMTDLDQTIRVSAREENSAERRGIRKVLDRIKAAPTISTDDVRGVGVWVEYYGDYRCSACGAIVDGEIFHMLDPNQLPRFCPLCGAKMEVSQESD